MKRVLGVLAHVDAGRGSQLKGILILRSLKIFNGCYDSIGYPRKAALVLKNNATFNSRTSGKIHKCVVR